MTARPAADDAAETPGGGFADTRPGWQVFLAVGVFLLATALTLGKPGLPSALRADEAAYLLAATSLLEDGDLRIDAPDVERLFLRFPYTEPIHLPIRFEEQGEASPDRPLLYPLLIAPALAAFGSNGPLALNVLLFLGAAALIARPLGGGGRSALLGLWILGLSAAFPYVYWIHPAVLWLALGVAAVAASSGPWTASAGGLAAALLTGQIPAFALLLPALLWRSIEERRWTTWLAGAALGAALTLGIAAGLEGRSRAATPGPQERAVVPLETPDDFAQIDLLRRGDPAAKLAPAAVGTLPNRFGPEILAALIERRTGLLAYFPLVLLALAAVIFDARSRPHWHWLLLAGAFGGIVLLTWRPLPGVGGELLGDPGKAALYPAFWLLVRRLPQAPATLGAVALAACTLGTAVVSALGPSVAYGSRQSYTRGGLIRHLPLSIGHVGAAGVYREIALGGDRELDARLWWPEYATKNRGDAVWLLGNERVELFLETARPVEGPTSWRLHNYAPSNVVKVALGDFHQRFAFPDEIPPAGQGAMMQADLGRATRVETPRGARYVYRLSID
ncbi:MAG: hypothetical protein AAF725_14035, partial [Acidobacteriota bacterium]